MRHAARLSTALGLLTVLLAIHPAVGRANCPQPLGANQVCVDEPPVNQATTDLKQTTFPAGSHVSIQANGCEQTGGSGDTWKRYVNPDPWSDPNNYHGEAGIYPSAGGSPTLSLTRIRNINAGTIYRVTSPSYLRVGFEDSDYTDNNYNDHDDGDGQCSWTTTGNPVPGTFYGSYGYGGPAYILLTVTPNAVPTASVEQPAVNVSGTTTFQGSGSDGDDNPAYQWLIDGQVVPGATGESLSWNSAGVADGTHTVALTVSDPYTSTTSAARTFRVDNTSPTVRITSGPSNQTFGPGSTQSWSFSASDGAVGSGVRTITCRVDSAPVACRTPSSHTVSNLAGGTHTFSVQATDYVGHLSDVDSRTFAIDATPPETTVTAGPAEGAATSDSTITYAFASTEPGSSFRCRVYADQPAPIKPDFAACAGGSVDVIPSPGPGAYVFEVYATDGYGNADPTPVVRHFSVPAPPPDQGGGTPTGSGGGTAAGGTPTGGGGSAGGGTPAAPVALTPQQPPAIRATLAYAYRSPTRLSRLTLKHVPRGSTVRVTCHGHCPKALRKPYTKRHVSGSLSLTRLVRGALRPGVRLSIVVSKPGWRSITKTLRIRRGKAPKVT
jgi:hypothetical protein